jgi:hypothetical protein
MRAVYSAVRDRPVTTSSRKTPAPRSPAPSVAPIRSAATPPRVWRTSSEPEEVIDAAAGAVMGGVGGVQEDGDAVADQHRDDGEERGEGHQAVAAAELEYLGGYESRPRPLAPPGGEVFVDGGGGRHTDSPSREVISKKRSSSDARAGSSR